jgi:hypothetical protein
MTPKNEELPSASTRRLLPGNTAGRRIIAGSTAGMVAAGLGVTTIIAMAGGGGAAVASPPLPPTINDGAEVGGPLPTPTSIAGQAALDIPDVINQAQTTYGSAYAGFAIDNSGPLPILNIYVASSPTSAALTKSFKQQLTPPHASTTVVQNVKYSQAQITAFLQTVSHYVTSTYLPPIMPSSSFAVFPDPVDNAVVVQLAHADVPFLAPIQALIPADALKIKWEDTPNTPTNGPGWITGLGINNIPPYKAGLQISNLSNPPGTGNLCTSGYTLEINGQWKGVTAGHCGSTSNSIWSLNSGQGAVGSSDLNTQGNGDYWTFHLANQGANEMLGQILAFSNNGNGFVDNVRDRQHEGNEGI